MKKSLTQTEKKQFEYVIKLLSAAVNRTPAPLPYDGISWSGIINIAKICRVTAMAADMILSLPENSLPPDGVCAELRKMSVQEILIDGNISYETEKLLRSFDRHGVKNIPLKGYFMKLEYPRPDYRSVSDVDILFDRNQLADVNAAFKELDYKFVQNSDNQYHYKKLPVMYIEMHASLVHEYEAYYPYLKNQLDNSSRRTGYDCSYQMSTEDYYIYMLVHNSNHFRIGGMGIRMALDTYLYFKNHKGEFDFEYLNKRLELFGLAQFEKKVRQIAFNWFSSAEPVITFDDSETYIMLSATLGRLDVAVMIDSQRTISESQAKGKRKSKLSFLVASVFPAKRKMQYKYTYLEKAPFLLPVSWIQMWFKRFFIEKNVSIKRGISNRLSYSDEDVNYYKRLLDEFGFFNPSQ